MKRLVAEFVAKVGDAGTAEALGQALLPAGSLPRTGRTLYVIPSPLLARVPFAALRRNGRYLVEDHVLSEVPSLSALAAVGAKRVRLDGPPAVLANARQNLPDAEAEGRWVATHLGAGSQLSLGGQATSARLRAAGGAGVLHLALHSGVGPTGPWLELADRRVPAQDLLGWRVAANLVVLASCASAATPSPGLWGSLVSSFLAGGSPSVIGSLWSTEDRVSRELVQAFYDNGGTREPARALAEVQRRWLAAGRPVAHWAAFAAYGHAQSAETAARSGRSTMLSRQPALGE
jgi:CHAT domain-containing protein